MPASCLPWTDTHKCPCSRTGELLDAGLPSFRPNDLRRNAAKLLAVDRRVQVPMFTDGRAARHRFALVQTQGLRRRDAAELVVMDGPAARPHVPCLQKTETRRGELFAPPPTRGRSPRRGRRGSGRRAVADEGPVTVPFRTRARSPRRLRRGLGRRAAANEG
jgi:hypothetical protein